MASLLVPAPAGGPERLSQLLPSVKCSNCSQPVPLSELGNHVCSKPPPSPAFSLPKPPVSPNTAAATLLPGRLQGRVTAPSQPQLQINTNYRAPPPNARNQPPPSPQRYGTPSQDRLRTASPAVSFQARSSPLAQQVPGNGDFSRQLIPPQGPPGSQLRPPQPDPRARSFSSAGPPSPMHPPPQGPGLRLPNGDPRARSFSSASQMGNLNQPQGSARPPPSAPLPAPQLRPAFTNNAPPPIKVPPPIMLQATAYVPGTPLVQENINTQSGGEAGMAGVGRRGFAAVVRAAQIVTSHPPSPNPVYAPQPGRAAPPRFLDTDACSRSVDTPPLSAGSGYSSPGPNSPFPQSPLSPDPAFRKRTSADGRTPNKQSPPPLSVDTRIPSPNAPPISPSPQTIRMPFFEKFKNKLPGSDSSSIPISPSTEGNLDYDKNGSGRASTSSGELKKSRTPPNDPNTSSRSAASSSPRSMRSAPRRAAEDDPPMSPSSDSEYGLAYAESTDLEGDDQSEVGRTRKSKTPVPRGNPSPSNSDRSVYTDRSGIKIGKTSRQESFGSASVSSQRLAPKRSGSESSSTSASRSVYSRGMSLAGLGALDKAMETLRDDSEGRKRNPSNASSSSRRQASAPGSPGLGSPPAGASSKRSNTIQSPHPEVKSPKLPTRSKTGPSERELEERKEKRRTRRPKVCLRCEVKIEDGRWVQVDNGGVLCEKCWKNMYLPKCRRCNLPIEKQAVSSSDGQLKGKYHRECFNCHSCHKPFPDKTFYVYDGKPLCAYHYHEANDSLCAAAKCGQPIEGPCAVSHAGDRYHPEHMTCEYSSGCEETLAEYWEVDGRMLCERHAHAHAKRGGVDSDDEDEGWLQTSKGQKRITRFIDLTGGLR
ncbi:hypothetical protein BDN72DRAFT_385960 [Pluteus cervinus]|uniref:Uncharacterized protein n=1 Tax=Pluteus cervinus TaxID=181527 RepID=A0ACD3AAI9_9AGAR|nr:hypothetical protein BDN72DRAFT_385960 [Pluteus cervinus]